ncbi:hypothetical protein FRC06_009513, partial [Ceratobasidium sp. 370]
APAPSSAELVAWPRAAQQVNRDIKSVHDNYDHHEYPDEFLDLEHEHWDSWSTPKLHKWVTSNPFLDESSCLQMAGPHGICVGFLSVLQFTLNYARVAPDSEATERRLLSQGRAIYGPRDLHFLRRSAEKLLDFVKSSQTMLPATRPTYDTDHALRCQVWQPKGWCNVAFDGTITTLPASQLDLRNEPSGNVFDHSTEANWATIADLDTTATTNIPSSNLDTTQDQWKIDSPFDRNRILGKGTC